MMPKVSVIIPAYNRAHHLPRAILSVLSQSFKEYELIIVDDASTDDTRQVFKRWDLELRRHIECLSILTIGFLY